MGMKIHGQLTVLPKLPSAIDRLQELADDLYWTWTPAARDLFRRLDRDLLAALQESPVALLREIPQHRLEAAAEDRVFLEAYSAVMSAYDAYLAQESWFAGQGRTGDVYAYFCAEYGWHESIPIYSGGLGILAGDHTKAASDLGVPLVAVGLWYPEGYFHQRVADDGTQEAEYTWRAAGDMPFERVVDADGRETAVTVRMFGRDVVIKAWLARVGRVRAYLLDVDVPGNEPRDRDILRRLYGGDQRTRIAQEMILGIGGVRLLRAIGVEPTAWHMNEGHSAFMALERCRELVRDGLSFDEAREAVAANTVFTVHTPVAAGNDAFDFGLVAECMGDFPASLGLDAAAFGALAAADHGWGEVFSMPALALRFSTGRNGVAELHGDTSRRIWASLWPGVPVPEVPIGHVTNGVHRGTWMARDIQDLLDRTLPGDWRRAQEGSETWAAVHGIDDAQFWETRQRVKEQSVRFLRRRVLGQLERQHASQSARDETGGLFDPRTLTIGFARRFATYKRATLIFTDLGRLERLLGNPDRPVQLVFAGKAHPADRPGQELIGRIHLLSQDARFRGRILFVEDYDMAVGRALTRGVDVWLNNPRRPLEASGTSGEKAAMNGVLNLSVLDGWWPEGYNGENGWAFGMHEAGEDPGYVDASDADALYRLLEEEVVPLYYQRDANDLPRDWIARAKSAVASIAPAFSAQRMVRDYVELLYAPATERGRAMVAEGHGAARRLAQWRRQVGAWWPGVKIAARIDRTQLSAGEAARVTAELAGVPDGAHVSVQLLYGTATADAAGPLTAVELQPARRSGELHRYEATFVPELSGQLVYGVRVLPVNELLASQADGGFVAWA